MKGPVTWTRRAHSEGQGRREGQGANWHLATSLLNLRTAQPRDGRTGDAEELFTRTLPSYQAFGDRHFTARVLIQLGYTALTGGQPGKAADPIRQAMRISAQLAETTANLAPAADRPQEQISMRPIPPMPPSTVTM